MTSSIKITIGSKNEKKDMEVIMVKLQGGIEGGERQRKGQNTARLPPSINKTKTPTSGGESGA